MWNENWQGKQKYLEKTSSGIGLSNMNSMCIDMGPTLSCLKIFLLKYFTLSYFSLTNATFPVYLILLDLAILII
jgi:hypothetical protein